MTTTTPTDAARTELLATITTTETCLTLWRRVAVYTKHDAPTLHTIAEERLAAHADLYREAVTTLRALLAGELPVDFPTTPSLSHETNQLLSLMRRHDLPPHTAGHLSRLAMTVSVRGTV